MWLERGILSSTRPVALPLICGHAVPYGMSRWLAILRLSLQGWARLHQVAQRGPTGREGLPAGEARWGMVVIVCDGIQTT
eukprot:10372060-Lingulodinium_polyedra.AAC.1